MTAITRSELDALVGQTLPPSRWFQMTQAMIDAHADVSQDWQFIHLDPERAAETPFGGTVAHGFLTLSMLSAMSYDAQPELAGMAMSVNYGLNHLRFVAPVRAGAHLRAHFTLESVEEKKPGELTLIWGVRMEIDGGSRPALVAEWVQRRYLE